MKRKYWMMGLLCSGMVLALSGCGKKKDAEPTPIPTVEPTQEATAEPTQEPDVVELSLIHI